MIEGQLDRNIPCLNVAKKFFWHYKQNICLYLKVWAVISCIYELLSELQRGHKTSHFPLPASPFKNPQDAEQTVPLSLGTILETTRKR